MLESFTKIGSWIGKYIGDGIFFIAVLAAAVYICIFMKEIRRRILIPVLVCILVIANPISYELVFKHVIYWRLFWMVPDGLILAIAGVHLFQRWKNDLARVLIGAGLCAVVILTGSNTYTHAAFGVSVNAEKISGGVKEVADVILSLDKNPRCIMRDRYLIEMRQYSGDIEMYYGRDVFGYIIPTKKMKRTLRRIIESEEPSLDDYHKLVSYAYRYGYDFLVVHISKPIPSQIAGEFGYRAVTGIDGSTIYYCPELCNTPANAAAEKEKEEAIKEARERKAAAKAAKKAAKKAQKEAEELAKQGLSLDDGTAQLWGDVPEGEGSA